jgi:uncharacterized protein with GYD domain
MPYYLSQASWTPEGLQAFMNNPEQRRDLVVKAIENLGGKVESSFIAFGDYDMVSVLQMPDNVSAAAFAMAVSAGGMLKSVKTTPLMSVAEALEAVKKVGKSGYKTAIAGR